MAENTQNSSFGTGIAYYMGGKGDAMRTYLELLRKKANPAVQVNTKPEHLLSREARVDRLGKTVAEGVCQKQSRQYVVSRIMQQNPKLEDIHEKRDAIKQILLDPLYLVLEPDRGSDKKVIANLRKRIRAASIDKAQRTLKTEYKGRPRKPSIQEDPKVMKKHRDEIKEGTYKYEKVKGGILFVDGPSATDIRQGDIGDCYFVAALSAVADANPEFIKDMITDNGQGVYTVRFFKNGKPIYVKVDGDLPQTESGRLIYGRSTQKNELWVSLVEKAYAKLKGSYQKIGHGGYTQNVLSALTGKEATSYKHKYKSTGKLWSILSNAVRKNWPITVETHGNSKKKIYNKNNLVGWHVYTVIDVVEEQGKRYVVVRNPHGKREWNGDGADKVNDGIFKIPIEDYKKYFRETSIVKKSI